MHLLFMKEDKLKYITICPLMFNLQLVYLQEKPNYVRLLDAEGGLVYQSHYKVLHSCCLKMNLFGE